MELVCFWISVVINVRRLWRRILYKILTRWELQVSERVAFSNPSVPIEQHRNFRGCLKSTFIGGIGILACPILAKNDKQECLSHMIFSFWTTSDQRGVPYFSKSSFVNSGLPAGAFIALSLGNL